MEERRNGGRTEIGAHSTRTACNAGRRDRPAKNERTSRSETLTVRALVVDRPAPPLRGAASNALLRFVSVTPVAPGQPWRLLLTERSQPCELLVQHVAAVRRARATNHAKRTESGCARAPGRRPLERSDCEDVSPAYANPIRSR